MDPLVIEKAEDGFDVYQLGEYGPGSVLEGQFMRSFIDSFETIEAAKRAYPMAELIEGTSRRELNLGYLPDENGNTYTKEGYDL
jgi:hypothetical protein